MKTLLLTLPALFLFSAVAQTQTLDTVVFGNTTSESSHSLTAYFPPASNISTVSWQNTPPPSDPSATGPSDVVSGGLGLSARRLLPRTPDGDVYGGQITFTMTVDPLKQNYFTLKLWGSDPNGGIYLILNCEGKEIGLRHGGGGISEDPLWAGASGWFANRFFYRTEPLPLSMTRGKTSVTITVRSLGSIFDYAPIFTYVPQYQSLMKTPSESLYSAYTHAGALFDSSSELQGTAPQIQTPRALETEAASIANVEAGVNAILSQDMLATPTNLGENDADVLATIYDARVNTASPWIAYPNGLADADLGKQVIAILDGVVSAYALNPSLAGANWGGNFGPMGDAIRLTWPLISSSMSATVNYGGSLGTTTRQAAWATALRASVDDGRYGRQTISAQAFTNGSNIWYANAGLLLVDSTKALNASEAIRYTKEAVGVQPWLGNDQATGGTDGAGGGPVPTYGLPPYGPNWYMGTTKGTTKDGEGFVGSDYGELGTAVYRMGLLSGDAQLQARALVMTRARNIFRYPGPDESGYLMMMGPEPVGVRNNDLPGHYVYLGRGGPDDFLMASQGASAIGADLLGHLQEQINDGQAYRFFYYQDPYLPSRWATIKAQPQTNQVLPMAIGQPDFAWADEENMIVAAKHGEERFYANLFWRQPGFINGLAKVFDLTPTLARLGDVMVDEVRFRSTGQTITTNPSIDGFATPPDNPQDAFAGLPMSLAYRSDLTAVPAFNRDAGRGTGYTLRYGNWLIGINADYSATYNVKLPSDFTSATDLISGKTMSGPVTLAAKTSVVFYLPTTTDPSPTPSRSLYTAAVGTNGGITVTWANAGSATTYNLLRSTTSGSGYTTIASGLTGSGYLDTNVTAGTTYYYVVTSVNSIGVSGNSPETSAKLVAPETTGLPAPWTDFDEGNGSGGSASISGGTFTLKSVPGTGGAADGTHTVYQVMSGDGAVTARVQSQTSTNGGANAGVVMRDNLLPSPTMASMVLRPNNAANFNYIGADGGGPWGVTYGSSISAPYWVRLVRTGVTITGFISPDGITWTSVGSYTYSSLPYNIYVGLFVNSGPNTAVFTNVTLPLGATVAASAPTGLTALYAGTTSVSLSWNGSPGAVSYNVKRSASASGPFTAIASGVVTNAYSDYGLVNGKTYYYVVSAVNSLGESANSSVATAALLPPPATLSGFTASVSGTQAMLSWNAASGATSYVISRATSYAGPYTVIASGVTANSYVDTSVSANTLYYYKAIPVGSAGSGMGSIISAVTGSLPAPWQTQDVGLNVPGGAYASGGIFTLFGNGYVYGNYGAPFRYVYQTVTGDSAITIRITGQMSGATGIMIRDSADIASRYVFLDLTSWASGSQAYWEYRSAYGGGISASFGGVPSTFPCWLRAVRLGSSIALYLSSDGQHWNPYAGINFAMNSTVMMGMATTSGDPVAIDTATIDNVSLTAGFLGGGTATATSGNPPAQTAAQAFDDNIGTKWYDPAFAGSAFLQYQFPGGSSYVVNQYQVISSEDVPQRDPASWTFQGSNDGVTWTTLDTQTAQLFSNRNQVNVYNITNTTAYQYYQLNVSANAGGSAYGLQLSELGLYGLNAGTAIIAPTAPLDLSATWSSGQIALTWQATFAATSYNVKRSNTSGGPYTTIASGLTTSSYSDSSVANGTTYYYVVSAINAGGESLNSIENSATPNGVPSVPTSLTASYVGTQVTVNWSAVSGATQYSVQRSTTSGGPYSELAIVSTTSYIDKGLNTGSTYYYVVAALNLGELSANSAQVSAVLLPPDAPSAVAASAGNTVATLTWTAPAVTPRATGYIVQRATTDGGPYTAIVTNLQGTSYTDTGLTNGTTYYYLITPQYSATNGDSSIQVSVTPTAGTAPLVRSVAGIVSGTTTAGDSVQETPAQAFDGNAFTKWYTAAIPTVSQPDWLQYQFGNNLAWSITQYQITSANDVPQRDPAAWQFLASNDGVTWTTLDTRTAQTFSARYATNSYAVTNTTPYEYYRLNITATNGGSGYGTQLSEFVLISSASDAGDKTPPVITVPANITTVATSAAGAMVSFSASANDAVSGVLTPVCTPASGSQFATAITTVQCSATDLAGNTGTAKFTVTVTPTPAIPSASAGTSGEQAAQAFDSSMSTKWYNGVTGGTGWLQYQFANFAQKTVVGYAISSANDVQQRDPAAWQFEGSNDGSSWTILDTRSAQTFAARNQTNLYSITGTAKAFGYYRLNITANHGGASYGVELAELSFIYPLPSPWTSSDIGTTGATGAVGADSNIFTMVGAGTNLQVGTTDALRFTYQSATGNGSVTARIASFTTTNTTTKVGVMIRESLNANSRSAAVFLTPSNGVSTAYRSSTGGTVSSKSYTGSAAPYWLRVTRSGNTFTFYSSADGVTWKTLSSTTISMASNAYIGMALSSGSAGSLTIANVDNVTAVP